MKTQSRFHMSGALVVLLSTSLFLISGCGAPSNPTTFSLGSGKKQDFNIEFKAGEKVDIWITSEHDSDVDLFVYDTGGAKVTDDTGDSQHCHVSFVPASTQTYKVEVQNRVRLEAHLKGRNRDNTCTLKWTPAAK